MTLRLITAVVVVGSAFALLGGNIILSVLLMLAIVICAAFTITKYRLHDGQLYIDFPGRSKAWDLTELQRLEVNPNAMDGSFRLFGTGIFASVGLYCNSTLGWYRAYTTNPKLAVVLYYPKLTVVITPDNPERFAELAKKFIKSSKP